MDVPLPVNVLHCTQCGGELHPDEGQVFLTCPFCSSTVYLDKSQVVFHWYLAPTLDEEQAKAALARWMAGNETVKDLDRKAMVTGSSFEYFPMWYFKRRTSSGKEEIILEPAAATSVSEVRRLRLPAGDLRKYSADLEKQSSPPSVPLETALGWLRERGIPTQDVAERALVHLPLFTIKYAYQANPYTAIVEGGTGGVFANIFPAKVEAPYLLAGGLAAGVFLCLATFPVIGALFNSGEGFGMGLLACTGLGVLAAPALFALAVWVAAKV
jgi:hypothetical protein